MRMFSKDYIHRESEWNDLENKGGVEVTSIGRPMISVDNTNHENLIELGDYVVKKFRKE